MNNREWALVTWGVVAVIAMLCSRDLRSSIASLVRTFFGPKIFIPILIFAGYMSGITMLARSFGLWSTDLLGSTTLWFVVGGIVLFVRSTGVSEQPDFMRHQFRRAVGVGAFLEAFVGLYVFSLPVELVLLPALALIAAMAAVAEMDEQYATTRKLLQGLMAFASVAFIIYSAVHVADASGAHLADDVHKIVLPVWLTIGALPFIYVLGLYAAYEMSFLRIDFCHWADTRARRRAKLALLLGVNLRARPLGSFGGPWPGRVVREPSLEAARRVVRQFRVSPSS